MLNNIRNKTKSISTKIFLLVIAASFALWGVGDIFSNRNDSTIASVGEENISAREFLRTYQRIVAELRRDSKGQITEEIAISLNVHTQTLNQMINEKIIDLEMKKMGLSVSKESLKQVIIASPFFKDQLGQFSPEQFSYTLRQLGLDEESYLKELSKSILRDQIINVFDFENNIPSIISNIHYRIKNEKRDIKTITFSSNNYKYTKNVSNSEVKEFYEQSSEKYKYPENRSFTIISIKPADIIDSIQISEEVIINEYKNFPEKYGNPEEREIFLINLETEEEAIDLLNKIGDSSNFLEEAGKISNQDKESLNLGLVTFKDLPKELADKAFKAELFEMIGPKETPFGWRIFVVNEIKEATSSIFSDVKEKIIQELKTDIAIDKLYDLGNVFYDEIASGSSIEEAAQSINANIENFYKINKNGINLEGKVEENLPPYPELLELTFSTELNDTSNLVNTIGNIMFAVHINEINLSRPKTIEEARNNIINDIKEHKSVNVAQKNAESFIEKIKLGKSFEQLALEDNLVIIELNNVKLGGSGAEGVLNQNALFEIFKLDVGQVSPLTRYNDNSFTISKIEQIKSVKNIDQAELDIINKDLKLEITGDLRDMFIKQLLSQHNIKINKNVFDSLFM